MYNILNLFSYNKKNKTMLYLSNHLVALFILLFACNLAEFFRECWTKTKWYIPSEAAIMIFGFVEVFVWGIHFILQLGV